MRQPTHTAPALRRTRGFTLVEILIVVVILGILAAIVVPHFTSAADQSRDSSLRMDLYRIRQQIQVYKEQHGGAYPTAEDFVAQMTMASNADGDPAAPGTPGYPYGPYLRDIPKNPFNSRSDVSSTAVSGTSNQSAWFYDPTTGAFRANDSEQHHAY